MDTSFPNKTTFFPETFPKIYKAHIFFGSFWGSQTYKESMWLSMSHLVWLGGDQRKLPLLLVLVCFLFLLLPRLGGNYLIKVGILYFNCIGLVMVRVVILGGFEICQIEGVYLSPQRIQGFLSACAKWLTLSACPSIWYCSCHHDRLPEIKAVSWGSKHLI